MKSSKEKHRHPYFVEMKDSGQILCEKSCMLYCSCKICSYSVAVAYHTKSSQKYLTWLQKYRGNVSLSVLANANMPKGAGKKPNGHRQSSSKAATKRIKELVAEADSEQFTPRIKRNIKDVTSSHEYTQVHTPEMHDDMPGPSELSFSHSCPPPLCSDCSASSTATCIPLSSSDYDQSLDQLRLQPPPPPLVSSGPLV